MPPARNPARNQARAIWEDSGGTLKLREIAEQLNVPEATVRAWKTKDDWDKKEKSTAKKKRNVPNDKQKRFADEYLIDSNATKAATRAGYKNSNIGRRLVAKSNVSKYIQQKQKRLQKKTEITQEKVLAELAEIAFASIADYLEYKTVLREVGKNKDGNPIYDWAMIVNVRNSTEVNCVPIQKVSVSKDGTFKFKMYSKLDALEKIARHLGLFNDKQTVTIDTEKDSNLIDLLTKLGPK